MSKCLMVVAMLCGTSSVFAGTEIYDDSVSGCLGINCSSLRIPGTVFNFVNVNARPWVVQLFKGGNECVRIDVDIQFSNLEIVAVSPNGTVYRNDDRVAAVDFRPLVNVPPFAANGWYTVQVSAFNGAPVESNFVLLYGRYVAGNPNCVVATPPVLTAE
ncbi:hypothetical protein [Chitinivorax sp. B]|uniref:hypothetical protein n=1 Tax=Chitinivorax sp. B TaxID=2502235 RepID=UPI0010F44117|nr:hypothetical protein [Chitinivorax sp. B]